MDTTCPICAGRGFSINRVESFYIFKCDECQLEFTDPMPTEHELSDYYKEYTYYTEYEKSLVNETIARNARRNIEYLRNFGLSKKSTLLDFGCGENIFVSEGDSNRWVGYDYPVGSIPDGKFDFITLYGVLEHLAEPESVLLDLTKRLTKNGILVMTTVGIETGIPYRHRVPIHLFFWSNKSIKILFDRLGIRIMELRNYTMLQDPGFYLDRILDRGQVPKQYRKKITINIDDYIEVPTNEIFIVGKLCN